ncbi:MAG: hypothetical protein Kow0090_22770 [Myxococcota bacterium]
MARASVAKKGEESNGKGGRLFRVGDLAELFDKSVRAIRLYEERGLLKPISRSQGGFRLYDESSVTRLRWIILMQRLGFTLSQIADISEKLDRRETAPQTMGDMRELFREKLRDIKERIREIKGLEDELESAIDYLAICDDCHTEASFIECCPSRALKRKRQGIELPDILAGLYAPYFREIETGNGDRISKEGER